MSEPSFRFSLWSLFTAMTLVAILVATIANYPVVLIPSLLFLAPFLFIALMVHLHNCAVEDANRPIQHDVHHEVPPEQNKSE